MTRQAAPAGDTASPATEATSGEVAQPVTTQPDAAQKAPAPAAAPAKKTGSRRARTASTVSTTPASLTDAPVTAPTTTTAAAAAPTLDVLAELDAPKAAPRRRRATSAGTVSTAPAPAAAEPAPTSDDAPAPRTARRSRSRAAAEKVATDHEAEVSSLDVVASIEAMTSAGAPSAEAETRPATKSRRSRSASKHAGPPAGTEQADKADKAAATATTAAPEVTPAAEEAPAPRTRATGRARASRAAKSAAPAATDSANGANGANGADSAVETPAAPANEPAAAEPRKTRSRSARGSRSAAPAAEAEQVVAETVAEPVAETVPEAAPPARSRTALLFQAPDTEAAPPRRRRAQSPAGPPKAIFAATGDTEDSDQLDADAAEDLPAELSLETDVVVDEVIIDEDATEDGSDSDEDNDNDHDANGAPRRRRRRGGRGRRNRGGSDNQRDEYYDADDAERSGSDEASEETAEESGDEAAPARSRRRSRSAGSAGSAGTSAAEAEDTTGDESEDSDSDSEADDSDDSSSSRRRRRRRRGARGGEVETTTSSPAPARTRTPRVASDEVTALKGSTRLEAKRQRRREGRDAGRRRSIITEAEFLARREAVERSMIVRERGGRTQIAVLEDGVLVEHYVSQQSQASMAGNVYLGRVQNVLPSMEAAFVDVGKGRNAVLYAGEVNWDAVGLEGQPRRIEQALKSGDSVLVQVTKDPIGQKGARLTSQVTLAGRYLVYVPGGGMTGISRKLPDNERARLKKILREVVPETAGVIVRTAAEGASEAELRADIARLQAQWDAIEKKAKTASAPALLQGEPDLAIRVVRDIFNDDFTSLTVSGNNAWAEISQYVNELAPDLAERVTHWVSEKDVFAEARIDEQLAKGLDRKVWLPSGGSLVIDRTEAMTVVDVNTGKFTGSGGTLEETVTRNNLEAAEEIVRQLRLRDIGGIIVIDFIDMVLESNRDLVLRRLVECLGRDRTKHQVAEVTSLGLVQMTRKRVGQGLVEAFSETCDHCNGRGFIVHDEPNEKHFQGGSAPSNAQLSAHSAPSDHEDNADKRSRRKRGGAKEAEAPAVAVPVLGQASDAVKATLATIAAAAAHAHEHDHDAARPATSEVELLDGETVEVVDVVDADEVAELPEVTEVTEVVELVEVDVVEPAADAPQAEAPAAEAAPAVVEAEQVPEERPAPAKRPARTSRRATRPAPTRAVLDVFAEVEASQREAAGNGGSAAPQD
ncbi:Rne/Rng family ribonuclease [Sanguibacter suarezii]|uniref:Rne/Rng family ribonuclease n=1 Tax=Sanguibacter suarezii TaxID=60921 RepID=UPI001FE04B45|nr:Rne/Rng family ribonuclease [Sanguibacter suarezii]